MKVTHLILCLGTGGAEMMLYRLLSRMDRSAFRAEVISLMGNGAVGDRIAELGVPVRTVGLRADLSNPYRAAGLAYWLRREPPDVIQTWMYHANFAGSLIAPLVVKAPIVWGIHHSNLDPAVEKRRTIWIARACGWMSRRLPARIICCSEATRIEHARLGYALEKMEVIPNGFDLSVFKPDPAARHAVRQELGIAETAPVIGHLGRFHKQKDHHNFLQAAGLLRERFPEARFVLCGSGVTWENPSLSAWIDEAGVRQRCRLLGLRGDTARLLASLDIVTSSSCVGEAFPLIIGEAMACGVPCVVTDVGDSAALVGDTGLVVPARSPHLLAEAWFRLLEMPSAQRRFLGERARLRVAANFELSRIADRYHAIYREVSLAAKRNRNPAKAAPSASEADYPVRGVHRPTTRTGGSRSD